VNLAEEVGEGRLSLAEALRAYDLLPDEPESVRLLGIRPPFATWGGFCEDPFGLLASAEMIRTRQTAREVVAALAVHGNSDALILAPWLVRFPDALTDEVRPSTLTALIAIWSEQRSFDLATSVLDGYMSVSDVSEDWMTWPTPQASLGLREEIWRDWERLTPREAVSWEVCTRTLRTDATRALAAAHLSGEKWALRLQVPTVDS
jgi:hypothetical protein